MRKYLALTFIIIFGFASFCWSVDGDLVYSPVFNTFNVSTYSEGSDTANIQAAIDAAEAVNGRVFVPGGTYTLTSTLTIDASIEIFGNSTSATIIQTASTTDNIFYINTPDAVIIHNIWIRNTGAGTPTAGAGIYVDGGATNNGFSRFKNLTISGMYRGIFFKEAAAWTVSDSYIVNNILEGIRIENTYVVDSGDSTITRCIFDNSDTSGTYAIHQLSSGGLRLINNKILSHEWGYFLDILNGISTSILLIQGNSIENFATSGIHLDEEAGGTFLRIIIDGNQITSATGRPIYGEGGLTNFVISDNVITVGTGDYGILLNDGDYFTITGNEIYGDGTDTGIGINANCSYGVIANNAINNFATRVVNNSTTVSEIQPVGGALLLQPNGGTVGIGVTPSAGDFEVRSVNIQNTAIYGQSDKASGTIRGVQGVAAGASTKNTGVFAEASGATTNYGFEDNQGNYSKLVAPYGWVTGASYRRYKFDIEEFNAKKIDDYYAALDTMKVHKYKVKKEIPIIGYDKTEEEIDQEITAEESADLVKGKKWDELDKKTARIKKMEARKPILGDPQDAPDRWGLMVDDLPNFLQTENNDGFSNAMFDNYFWLIVQHQKKLIEDLTARVEALEAKN